MTKYKMKNGLTVYKMTEGQALEWRQRMLDRALPVEEEPPIEGDE